MHEGMKIYGMLGKWQIGQYVEVYSVGEMVGKEGK